MGNVIPFIRVWLEPELIRRFEPYAEKMGVSVVARGPTGFLRKYLRAGGPARLAEAWREKRNNFVKRHVAQMASSEEPFYRPDGFPTRRHLALIMWAYSPDPGGLQAALEREGW